METIYRIININIFFIKNEYNIIILNMYIYIYIKYNSFLCKMSTNNKIIIIGGKKSSGKDTVADYITKKYNFKKMAIANKLKSIVKILFDFSDEQLNNEILKEKLDKNWKITPRQAMQFIGTDMFQFQIQKLCPNVGRNFWINSLGDLTPNRTKLSS